MIRASLAFIGSGVLVLACSGVIEGPPSLGTPTSPGSAGRSPNVSASGGITGSGGGAGAPGAAGHADGTYCSVLSVLEERCASCHSNPPARGVPMPLVDATDLASEAPDYPGLRAVDASIARMRDSANPMPPAPSAPAGAAEVAILEAWLAAGMPGECETGAAGAGGDPFDTPLVCTSERRWSLGDKGSPSMRPGGQCIACHGRGDDDEEGKGPSFAFAGTVFPTAHEPDDCNGLDGPSSDARVVVVGKNGVTFTAKVNAAGNFYLEHRDDLELPYRAKVVSAGRERSMLSEQTSGDCNSCHTEAGAMNAPGRIMAP